MNLTPEQQKELLEASLNLAAIAERNTDDADEWDAAIAAVEKFRPEPEKPKLLEGWVNVYKDGITMHDSRDRAKHGASNHGEAIRTAVHLREVVPPDEAEKWYYTPDGSITHFPYPSASSQRIIGRCGDSSEAIKISRAHNAALGFGKEGE